MLNIFPIQFLAPLAYFLLRIAVGFICIRLGLILLRSGNGSGRRKVFGGALLSCGTLIFIGLSTQLAAIGLFSLSIFGIVRKKGVPHTTKTALLLMAVIALSLFITGAGPFAFDLPL
jgi:hypothetical protein